MNEIIKVKNKDYARYEELLLERDSLRKEAYILEGEYIREFGDLILELFEKRTECISKKKIIRMCQTMLNKNEPIDLGKVQKKIDEEMSSYYQNLHFMARENEAAKNAGEVTQEELAKIKKLYRKLVKQLHPDINPKTTEMPVLFDLWQRIVDAYNSNNLEELQELDALAQAALKQAQMGDMEIEIPDIAEKIKKLEAEIWEIKHTDPYQYKYLLADKEAVAEKKAELIMEIRRYEEYSRELDEVIKNLVAQEGACMTWKMD